MTEYTYRATICTPVSEIYAANQLACIVGESAADIGTFTVATHTRDGVEYACISTVVKDVFAGYQQSGLPNPAHAEHANRDEAMRMFVNLNKPDGIVFHLTNATDSGYNVLHELGFEPIEDPE